MPEVIVGGVYQSQKREVITDKGCGNGLASFLVGRRFLGDDLFTEKGRRKTVRKCLLFLGIVVSSVFVTAPNPTYAQEKVAMVLIPAGEFTMGCDEFFGEEPAHQVYLNAFYIDKHEVTNEQFCQFLNEKGNQSEGGVEWLNISGIGHCKIEYREGKYESRAGYENHPVVGVSWYGASAYAKWRGCRLPTEAEWEKAARGGLVGKRYPWGDDIDPSRANYGQVDKESTTPVGSYPPNGYGLCDMAGNVWEWCSDWYERDYYSKSPYRDPPGPDSGDARVVRGGGWDGPVHVFAKCLRCSFRYFLRAKNTNGYLGFRCARDAQ